MEKRKNKCLRFNEKEIHLIETLAKELGVTQTEAIVKSLYLMRKYLDKKKQ